MLIETHLHTKNISLCSYLSYREAANLYKKGGYDAVMLTNHFSPYYPFRNGLTDKEWIDAYLNEYNNMKSYGKSIGLKVFLGMELSIYKESKYRLGDKIIEDESFNNGADFLLYGVSENFLRKHPKMYLYTVQEAFAACREAGILFIHAHPYRGGEDQLQPLDLIDGIEINCHPSHKNYEQKVLETAQKYDKIVTVGSDAHSKESSLCGGIYIPNDIANEMELAIYLRENKTPKYFIKKDR